MLRELYLSIENCLYSSESRCRLVGIPSSYLETLKYVHSLWTAGI